MSRHDHYTHQFLNIIIRSKHVRLEDRVNLFPDEEVVFVFDPGQKDMYDLLVILGMFKNKSQARKNWKKTGRDIPTGWTELTRLGKHRRELHIWNPGE
jgi:hypothetical protein